MLPAIIAGLNDPAVIVYVGWGYVVSYYLASWGFHYHSSDANHTGIWKKNGFADVVTSTIWSIVAIILILSLIDLLIRNELSLGFLLHYYVLFLLLFAHVYNIVEWHAPGSIGDMQAGWPGELQCVIMSIEIMTSAPYTSARPVTLVPESIAALQALLGLAFVAIFIAKAVALMV